MVKLIDAPKELAATFRKVLEAKFENDDFEFRDLVSHGFRTGDWWDEMDDRSVMFDEFAQMTKKKHDVICLGKIFGIRYLFLGTIPLLKKTLSKLEREMKLEAFK